MHNSIYVGELAQKVLVSSQSAEIRQIASVSQDYSLITGMKTRPFCLLSCSFTEQSFNRKFHCFFRVCYGQLVMVLSLSLQIDTSKTNAPPPLAELLSFRSYCSATEHLRTQVKCPMWVRGPRSSEGTNSDIPNMLCAPKSPLLTTQTLLNITEISPLAFKKVRYLP